MAILMLAAPGAGAQVAPAANDVGGFYGGVSQRHAGADASGLSFGHLTSTWNKFASRAALTDFDVRDGMAGSTLLTLWGWSQDEFLRRTEGSAIRRIGWARWRRNLAVALGNAWRVQGDAAVANALHEARPSADDLVGQHIDWALAQRTVAVGESAHHNVVPAASTP